MNRILGIFNRDKIENKSSHLSPTIADCRLRNNKNENEILIKTSRHYTCGKVDVIFAKE